MEQVLNKLKSQIDLYPLDDWDRGWNAAIRLAIREIEAAQQSVQRTAERSAEAVRRGEMEAIMKREYEA